MRSSLNPVLTLSIAALVGVTAAVMLAGPALFADGSDDERRTVTAILAVALGIGGFSLGFGAPALKMLTPWFLSVPTVLISVFFAWGERGILDVALLLVAGSVGFALAGTWLGARLRDKRATSDEPPPEPDRST